jgi:hypothetical protein
MVVVTGAWMVKVTVVDEEPAGRDDGEKLAIAPAGTPSMANVTAVGKVVPPDGPMVNMNVAVCPGVTVCV